MKSLLLLSTKPMENILTAIMQISVFMYEEIFNKISDWKSLTLATSFQMRSCSEIDINILFVFNTKCISDRAFHTWMFHSAKHQELILKVLAIFSFFTKNFWRKQNLVRFILLGYARVRDEEWSQKMKIHWK